MIAVLIENKEPLLFELDYIINSLNEYKATIENNDADTLKALLRDGRIAKKQVDG